jgi:protein-disulfide isomerase
MAPKTLEQKLVIGTTILFAFLALLGARLYEPDLPDAVVIDTENQPVLGNRLAPLEIVLFMDPKCPNCARYHDEILPEVQYVWVETNYAKVVMVPVCFLAGSRPAGMAMLEVHRQNPDLFFPYLELLYERQGPEEDDWCTADCLCEVAQKVPGVDCAQIREAILTARYAAALDHNLALALQTMKGELLTPSAFVEGMQVRQPSFEALNDLCEKTLSFYGID